MASGRHNPASSDSVRSGWKTKADGSRVNETDLLEGQRVPRKTIDVDAEKHASNPLSAPIRAFRVGTTAGNVVCRFADDSGDRTIPNVQIGELIQGVITHVRTTGTTAVGITGFV